MFNQFSLNGSAHGAFQAVEELVKNQFEGSRNLEEVDAFKQKIIALARVHQFERFLYNPVEDLVPDKTKYKEDDHSEMRQLQQDTDKIYELAAKAYALVKSRFKPNSQAAAVIQPAEETGRLDELWKLFLLHYDNPVTKAGADRLIRASMTNHLIQKL